MLTNNCEHDFSTADGACARCGDRKPTMHQAVADGLAAMHGISDPVTCLFCGTTADLDDAVKAGWEPYFWYTGSDGSEHACDRPACPGCTSQHLEADPQDRGDGMQLRAGEEHRAALLHGLCGTRGGA